MSDRTKGNIALLLTAVLWGTGFIGQKLGNQVMPPIAFNATRQLMAGIVMLPVLALDLRKSGYFDRRENSGPQIAYRRKRLLLATFICGSFLTLGTSLQQIGLVTVSAGKSGFISSIYIALVPLFSVFLGGKVSRRTVSCIAVALAGFALMSLTGDFGSISAGDWLTLASAACFASQIVAVNHFVNKGNAIAISVMQFLFSGAAGLIVAFAAEQPSAESFAAALPMLLYMTFVPTAMGYTLQIIGQNYTDPSIAALIMSLESVFAAIFGAIFLGEMMSVRELAGAAVIFAATIIGQIEPRGD